jgi:hypothetical protein
MGAIREELHISNPPHVLKTASSVAPLTYKTKPCSDTVLNPECVTLLSKETSAKFAAAGVPTSAGPRFARYIFPSAQNSFSLILAGGLQPQNLSLQRRAPVSFPACYQYGSTRNLSSWMLTLLLSQEPWIGNDSSRIYSKHITDV